MAVKQLVAEAAARAAAEATSTAPMAVDEERNGPGRASEARAGGPAPFVEVTSQPEPSGASRASEARASSQPPQAAEEPASSSDAAAKEPRDADLDHSCAMDMEAAPHDAPVQVKEVKGDVTTEPVEVPPPDDGLNSDDDLPGDAGGLIGRKQNMLFPPGQRSSCRTSLHCI